jgi:hypothetical protein
VPLRIDSVDTCGFIATGQNKEVSQLRQDSARPTQIRLTNHGKLYDVRCCVGSKSRRDRKCSSKMSRSRIVVESKSVNDKERESESLQRRATRKAGLGEGGAGGERRATRRARFEQCRQGEDPCSVAE